MEVVYKWNTIRTLHCCNETLILLHHCGNMLNHFRARESGECHDLPRVDHMCELIEGSCVVVSSIRASPVPFTESASYGEEHLTSLEEKTNMSHLKV